MWKVIAQDWDTTSYISLPMDAPDPSNGSVIARNLSRREADQLIRLLRKGNQTL